MSRNKAKDRAALEERIGYKFADKVSARTGAHPHLRAFRRQPRQQLSAPGIPRRPRARAGRSPTCSIKAFPKGNEGELSRRLADLVRKETCADVAKVMEIGPALKLGSSENNAGGRLRITILGDACEALVGAVFLDGGYKAAEELVERFWGERMIKPLRSLRDPKTMLQEWAQARGLPTPAYQELARTGPHHKPKFSVAVSLPDRPPAEGIGNSKRAAEQAAAAAMLTRVGVAVDHIDG